ncbi:MAG: PilZ domain-containing protein [Planctomycetota bacterium]|nr:PilZ domain-containing protein [Planctomycetota bacterium]
MDKRQHERAPIAFPIRLRIGNINDFTEQYTSDLSAGGIFVKMNFPPPIGTQVDLEFHLDPVNKTIKARGNVVRSIRDGEAEDGDPGMGVQFTNLGEEGKRFIELVVAKFNRAHPSQILKIPDGFFEEIDPTLDNEPPKRDPMNTSLQIRLRLASAAALKKRHAETLKRSRLFIPTDATRPLGTKVLLTLILEKENKLIGLDGEVVGVVDDTSTGTVSKPGLMVRVREVGEELEQLLRSADADSPAVPS